MLMVSYCDFPFFVVLPSLTFALKKIKICILKLHRVEILHDQSCGKLYYMNKIIMEYPMSVDHLDLSEYKQS